MDGFIKIHRQLLENEIWKIKPYSKGQAWVTILMLANYKKGSMQIKNGTLIDVERGECGYSELALADIFGWSRGKVKRFLTTLSLKKMIQQKNVGDRLIIKVLNYNLYQIEQQTVHQTVHQTDINKKEKKEKNISNNTHTNIKNSVCDFLNISDEEVSILKQYAKKSKANNVDAYVHSLIKSGGYKEILEKHKKVKSIVKEILPPKPVEISDEERSKVIAMIQEKKQELRKIIRGS